MNTRKPKVIVSTVGISLLTNALSVGEQYASWRSRLNRAANLTTDQIESADPELLAKVKYICKDALSSLRNAGVPERRGMSAELNGIYGIYKNRLDRSSSSDAHFLVCTDTFLGRATSEVLQRFLMEAGITAVNPVIPQNLRTSTTKDFSDGAKQLIRWCHETLTEYASSGYHIVFNLVGAFKALQGYMTAIGMFYADEIVYIFEGTESSMITIPKLPVKVDAKCLIDRAALVSMLESGPGYHCEPKELAGVPKTLVDTYGDVAELSEWGSLVWRQVKTEALASRLLDFPHLEYTVAFAEDFERAESGDRVRLQEALAKVAVLLHRYKGDLARLKADPSLLYENYDGVIHDGRPVGHFRVSDDLRVSCQKRDDGGLVLFRFGGHDLNRNPVTRRGQ